MYADLQREIGLEGYGAALIVTKTDKLLDAIDAVERDYELPLGAKSRRDPLLRAGGGSPPAAQAAIHFE